MSDQNDDIMKTPQDAAEESGPDNFFIDILTGNKESASPKKLLVRRSSCSRSSTPISSCGPMRWTFGRHRARQLQTLTKVEICRTTRRNRRIHDELPLVAEKYKEFRATGEMTL